MAASKKKSPARKPGALGRLGASKLGKGGAQDGPKAVGARAKRSKPNPILLGGLGLVAVAGIAKVAMPGLFGSGSSPVAAFPAPVAGRHFLGRSTVTTVASGSGSAPVGRPIRDPFTPPPGFAP